MALNEREEPQLPETFGRFVLARMLHRGGMGEVFLARSSIPDYPLVVVKRLRSDLGGMSSRERFRHEAHLAVRLTHPHVVQSLEVGEVDGERFIALEPIIGQSVMSVADRLEERREPAPIQFVTRLMVDVLSALTYLHAACDDEGQHLALLHRDITPGNVLLGYDGEIKVVDLGVASSAQTRDLKLTEPGTVVGTPAYVAPEFLRAEALEPTVDIYGLGGVAYRLLTGKHPFEGASQRVIITKAMGQRPAPAASLRPEAPLWLTDVIDRMLAHDPQDRPQSAADLRAKLLNVSESVGVLGSPAQLGRWLRALFETEVERDQATARAISMIDIDSLVPSKKTNTIVLAQTGTAPSLRTIRPPVAFDTKPSLPASSPPPTKSETIAARPLPPAKPTATPWWMWAAAVLAAVLLGGLSASPEARRRWAVRNDTVARLDRAAAAVPPENRAQLRLLYRADRALATGDYTRARIYLEDLEAESGGR